ncbi:MAG: hypothetical protein AB7L65_08075, partial [Hyphomonadaceae bacterium]
LSEAFDFLRHGFDQTNQVQGLLIALAATVFMQNWKQWLGVALLALLVHVAVDAIVPVLAGTQAFKLPPLMESAFWLQCASRYVGYLIVIGVFFAVKRVLLRRAPAAAH